MDSEDLAVNYLVNLVIGVLMALIGFLYRGHDKRLGVLEEDAKGNLKDLHEKIDGVKNSLSTQITAQHAILSSQILDVMKLIKEK